MGLFIKTNKKSHLLESDLEQIPLPEIILHKEDINFKPKKFIALGAYLLLLPIVTFSLIAYYLLTVKPSSQIQENTALSSPFQAFPEEATSTYYTTQKTEARTEALRAFFERYNSPLAEYANHIVKTADKYRLDWRLVPAIAMQESTLCKKIPKNSHNCWGFGIYDGKITKFESYAQAIETVTKTLAREYKEKRGLEHPNEIVERYTPGSTTWADKVSLVMNRIQESM